MFPTWVCAANLASRYICSTYWPPSHTSLRTAVTCRYQMRATVRFLNRERGPSNRKQKALDNSFVARGPPVKLKTITILPSLTQRPLRHDGNESRGLDALRSYWHRLCALLYRLRFIISACSAGASIWYVSLGYRWHACQDIVVITGRKRYAGGVPTTADFEKWVAECRQQSDFGGAMENRLLPATDRDVQHVREVLYQLLDAVGLQRSDWRLFVLDDKGALLLRHLISSHRNPMRSSIPNRH
jgi:hypothetical protein